MIRRRGPELALALGITGLAAFAVSRALRITSWALDETLFKQSALHYGEGLPGNLFNDVTARATSRLYSLLLTPIFATLEGDAAVRTGRAFSALLFVSTAIPVYLLARRVVRERWHAVAAALLAVACPWLTLTTTLYSENLAYPIFTWALLGMVVAIERPSVAREALALFLIALAATTRVQLVFVFAGWVLAVWIVTAAGGRAGFARRAWRMAPITHVILAVGLLALFWRLAAGKLHTDLDRVLGSYSEIQDRGQVSPDLFQAIAVEIVNFALPVGLVAAAAALAWWSAVLRGVRESPVWRFAVLGACVAAVLWVVTAYVQGGFLGERTEERYYLYAFPLVWIGAVAALESPRLRFGFGAFALVVLVAGTGLARPFSPEASFLAPASSSLRHVSERVAGSLGVPGLTPRDALVMAALLVVIGATLLWRLGPRARVAAVLVIPAVIQLATTGYAYAGREGDVKGIEGATAGSFAERDWIDEAADGDVAWLNNQRRDEGATGIALHTLFWNSSIRTWAEDVQVGLPAPPAPIDALGHVGVSLDGRTGALRGAEGLGQVVASSDSPFMQVVGRRRSRMGDFELLELTEPRRGTWLSRGLHADGYVDAKRDTRLIAFGQGPLAIEMTFGAPVEGAVALEAAIGGRRRELRLGAGETQTLSFDVCPVAGRAVGRLDATTTLVLPDARVISAQLRKVVVRPGPGACAGS